MPNIMVNGKLATVDGVQVPVTTGSVKDVLDYLAKLNAKPEAPAEAPKEEIPEEQKPEAPSEAPKPAAPKAK